MRWLALRRSERPLLRLRTTLLILIAALLAGAAGLLLSMRVNGPGPLTPLLTQSRFGTWLLERVIAPTPPAGSHVGIVGDNVGDLALPDLDGRVKRLSDWRGRILIVNVWASWCAPCRTEMPMLASFAAQQGGSSKQVIGIAQDDLPAIRSFLQRTRVNYPVLVDSAQGRAGLRLGNALGALPYTVLISADGKLLRCKLGPFVNAAELQDWTSTPEQTRR
jgi:thiol-disulfide isomerase/thioredoxin